MDEKWGLTHSQKADGVDGKLIILIVPHCEFDWTVRIGYQLKKKSSKYSSLKAEKRRIWSYENSFVEDWGGGPCQVGGKYVPEYRSTGSTAGVQRPDVTGRTASENDWPGLFRPRLRPSCPCSLRVWGVVNEGLIRGSW